MTLEKNKQTSDQTSSAITMPTLDNTDSTKPKPDKSITSKLSKDSKLMTAECKRCFDNKLCMFCSSNDHTAKECPKKTAKACAAVTTLKATPGVSIGAKK